jgi:hypothetical protein
MSDVIAKQSVDLDRLADDPEFRFDHRLAAASEHLITYLMGLDAPVDLALTGESGAADHAVGRATSHPALEWPLTGN